MTKTRLMRIFQTLLTVAAINIVWLPLNPGYHETLGQARSETILAAVRRSDAADMNSRGKIGQLPPAEHLRRAGVYMLNRAFGEARRHWEAIIDYYPANAEVSQAMLGIGRSYFQSKDYQKAFHVFDELARKHASVKEGREGLNYSAATLLRMGQFNEAADRYSDYITRFPTGERIETAHLNIIDTLREANRPKDALVWVAKTKQRFAGTATETNALFAELRLQVSESDWTAAVAAANQLSRRSFNRLVLTSPHEVTYLKGYSLDRVGNREEAIQAYLSIPDSPDSYYGWLATERLKKLTRASNEDLVSKRIQAANARMSSNATAYPAPYRQALVRAAKSRKIDPRFLLAIMRQESVFKANAKSPAGARGLLQLTIDTAQKYARGAGLNNLTDNDLYKPDVSILLGAEYVEQLNSLFPQQLEAIAASYNGGEDNVARWLARGRHKDPGVFTAEIGFEETKGYVQKVMANYRVYTHLYTPDLIRR